MMNTIMTIMCFVFYCLIFTGMYQANIKRNLRKAYAHLGIAIGILLLAMIIKTII